MKRVSKAETTRIIESNLDKIMELIAQEVAIVRIASEVGIHAKKLYVYLNERQIKFKGRSKDTSNTSRLVKSNQELIDANKNKLICKKWR